MDLFGPNPAFYVGQAFYEPGGTLGPRRQANLQLVYVHEGEATIEVDGEAYRVGEGEATLLVPGRREYFAFARDRLTRHGWCELVRPTLPAGLLQAYAALPRTAPLTERMTRLSTMALPLRLDAAPATRRLFDSLAAAILHDFLLQAGFQGDTTPPLPEPLRRAVAYVQQHFSGFVDLKLLAREAGITPQHLTRLFRGHLEKTPIQYLWETRVREGARLLMNTGLSVSEIAFRCGFATGNHFSRLVKDRYGIPPVAYRRRAWAGR